MASDELLMVVVLIVGIVVVAVLHLFRRRWQAQRRIARDAMVARLAQRFSARTRRRGTGSIARYWSTPTTS